MNHLKYQHHSPFYIFIILILLLPNTAWSSGDEKIEEGIIRNRPEYTLKCIRFMPRDQQVQGSQIHSWQRENLEIGLSSEKFIKDISSISHKGIAEPWLIPKNAIIKLMNKHETRIYNGSDVPNNYNYRVCKNLSAVFVTLPETYFYKYLAIICIGTKSKDYSTQKSRYTILKDSQEFYFPPDKGESLDLLAALICYSTSFDESEGTAEELIKFTKLIDTDLPSSKNCSLVTDDEELDKPELNNYIEQSIQFIIKYQSSSHKTLSSSTGYNLLDILTGIYDINKFPKTSYRIEKYLEIIKSHIFIFNTTWQKLMTGSPCRERTVLQRASQYANISSIKILLCEVSTTELHHCRISDEDKDKLSEVLIERSHAPFNYCALLFAIHTNNQKVYQYLWGLMQELQLTSKLKQQRYAYGNNILHIISICYFPKDLHSSNNEEDNKIHNYENLQTIKEIFSTFPELLTQNNDDNLTPIAYAILHNCHNNMWNILSDSLQNLKIKEQNKIINFIQVNSENLTSSANASLIWTNRIKKLKVQKKNTNYTESKSILLKRSITRFFNSLSRQPNKNFKLEEDTEGDSSEETKNDVKFEESCF